jgi:hypothetical protein
VFDFLGFTHYCGKTRDGRFLLCQKTQRKRMIRKLKELRREMRRRMHQRLRDQPGTHQRADNLQPRLLRKRAKTCKRLTLFHISIILELLECLRSVVNMRRAVIPNIDFVH